MRSILVGWVGLAVVAAACGETTKNGPTSPSGGGSIGGDAAGAPSVAGSSLIGGAGGAPASSGGAAGEESAAGAGGASLEPRPGYSLMFVPEFAPLEGSIPPPPGSPPNVNELGVSRDGSRVFAWVIVQYPNDAHHRLLTWSAETGSVYVPVPPSNRGEDMPDQICVADDGSAAFFVRNKLSSLDAFHWGPKAGLVQLPALSGVGVLWPSCNAAATRAAFTVVLNADDEQSELRYWVAGENDDAAKLVPWPLANQRRGSLALSRLGTRGVMAGQAMGGLNQVIEWTPTDGAVPLGTPVNEACDAVPPSDDGSSVAGRCTSGGFRWSSAAGYVDLGEDAYPKLLSHDGKRVWGMAYDSGAGATHRLAVWSGSEPRQLLDLPQSAFSFDLQGAALDGHVAFLNLALGPIEGPNTSLAAYWSADSKLTTFPLLPGTTQSEVSAWSDDGTLAAGHVADDAGSLYGDNPVLWDAKGVRDVLQELRDGQVDVSQISQMRIERVWPGSTIRFQGTCMLGEINAEIFFAELPSR